jgi:Tat protein translocase TatB subunit
MKSPLKLPNPLGERLEIGISPLLEAGEEGLGPTPAEVLRIFLKNESVHRIVGELDKSRMTATMFGIGTTELFVIFIILLVVFGPKQLPKLARSLGRALNDFKDASRELKDNLMEETREFKSEIENVKGEIDQQVRSIKTVSTADKKSEKEKSKETS